MLAFSHYIFSFHSYSLTSDSYFFREMDNVKWQEKIKTDEDEFVNYSKGKYFADEAFFEAISAGKYFEEDIAEGNVKVNSEIATKSCTDSAGYSNKKAVRLETAKETTKHRPNGEASSKKNP